MWDFVKWAIEFSKDSERRLVRLLMFFYQIIMLIELSLIIAREIGFVYTNPILTYEVVINFFTSYQIVAATLIFLFSMISAKYITKGITSILSSLMDKVARSAVRDRKFITWLLNWLDIRTPDGTRGKSFNLIQEIHEDLHDSESVIIKLADYILSLLVLTLVVYKLAVAPLKIFPGYIDSMFCVVLWMATVYWTLNSAALKTIKKFEDRILNVILNTR